MDLEHNKQAARAFLAASARRDADAVSALTTEDATFWTQGKPHLVFFAGERSKSELLAFLAGPSVFRAATVQSVGAVTAEGDRVAVEVESHGVTLGGKHYDNTYHYLFFFRDGKISRIKEYLDTYHAAEVFIL